MAKHKTDERGIAMVLALVLMSALSVLAASLMFLSQTETYASMNYRMMSQTRYAAESAVQRAANFLMDETQYVPPADGGTDLLSYYDRTASPVTCASGCTTTGTTPAAAIVLSSDPAIASNYPVAAVRTAFDSAATGSLTVGQSTISYKAVAHLISMQRFESYGGGVATVQTWEITGTGTMSGSRPATVEVIGLVETPKVSANSYAAFATSNQCSALYFHGNVDIDSYDSTNGGTYAGTQTAAGGNVGTNGNFQVGGSAVDVMGNLYSPRAGVGACSNNGTITALTGKSGTIWGSVVQLPKAMVYPTPYFSVWPDPTQTVTIGSGAGATCAGLASASGVGGFTAANCSIDTTDPSHPIMTINGPGGDITMPNVVIASNWTLNIQGKAGGQNVNVNSIDGSAGTFAVTANQTSAANEAVVLKVAGKNPTGVSSSLADPTDMEQPIVFSTWKQNSSATAKYDASSLQIVYPGTGELEMDGGNSQSAGVIYAPNASFLYKGTQDWYGSILAKTIENEGNGRIHYDRRLSRDFFVKGVPAAGTFSWKRAS